MARRGRGSGRSAQRPNQRLPRDHYEPVASAPLTGYGAEPHVGSASELLQAERLTASLFQPVARVSIAPVAPRPSRLQAQSVDPLLAMSREEQARDSAFFVCLERAQRREVLHARNVAGKSGVAGPRYSPRSKVKC